MNERPLFDPRTRTYKVALVGNDSLVAALPALPARPVQFAHAVLAYGFDLALPVSWGEEALAHAALQQLSAGGNKPVIFCACPSVRDRLLSAGSELAPHLISLVAPPVAAQLSERGISVAAQPTVFDSVVPPDRRRPSAVRHLTPTRKMWHLARNAPHARVGRGRGAHFRGRTSRSGPGRCRHVRMRSTLPRIWPMSNGPWMSWPSHGRWRRP